MPAGYRVIYYDNHADDSPKLLHEPLTFGNKLSSGQIEQSVSDVDTFVFSMGLDHEYYNSIQPIVGLVKVVNLYDNQIEFYGRVLTSLGEMSDSNGFSKVFTCESILGYTHDSTQIFEKIPNNGIENYLSRIINVHNSQVEAHKQFKLGSVTVQNTSDTPYRYIGYESTFETIKTQLVGRLGGYIQLRIEEDGNYIDYLEEVGDLVQSPIQLGANIKAARRELNLDGLITRLVPVGGDLDTVETRSEETGQYVTRERVTIKSVNNGQIYLEDEELVKEFGIIQNKVDWNDITSASILKIRGQQYLDNQRIALASWELDTVELYLIDKRYTKFVKGNRHPIINPPLGGMETLQIIKKDIDILFPQRAKLTIGSTSQSLSAFQLQQQEANKSMQKVLADQAKAIREAELKTKIAQLTADITQSKARSTELGVKILALENQLRETLDESTKVSIQEQIKVIKEAKVEVDKKIDDMNLKLDELKKGVDV